jgi:DNA-binding PadR family transcriptional regulator
MSLKHGLLGLLNQKPMTGYDLAKEFRDYMSHFWQAKSSNIYRDLDAMEKKGWLVSKRVIQDEKPNKRVYSITDKGKAEFMDWFSSPDEDIRNTMNFKCAFCMRLYFADETSKDQALKMLYAYREQRLNRAKEMEEVFELYEKMKDQFDPEEIVFQKLLILQGDIIQKARLTWVEKAIAILEGREAFPF